MEYLIWVIANSGEYYPSQMDGIQINFTPSGNSPRGLFTSYNSLRPNAESVIFIISKLRNPVW
jgi:hypothetical protein